MEILQASQIRPSQEQHGFVSLIKKSCMWEGAAIGRSAYENLSVLIAIIAPCLPLVLKSPGLACPKWCLSIARTSPARPSLPPSQASSSLLEDETQDSALLYFVHSPTILHTARSWPRNDFSSTRTRDSQTSPITPAVTACDPLHHRAVCSGAPTLTISLIHQLAKASCAVTFCKPPTTVI